MGTIYHFFSLSFHAFVIVSFILLQIYYAMISTEQLQKAFFWLFDQFLHNNTSFEEKTTDFSFRPKHSQGARLLPDIFSITCYETQVSYDDWSSYTPAKLVSLFISWDFGKFRLATV